MAVSKAQRQVHGKRAAIYARVSDKSQAEDDKTSLSEQIGDMEAHCEDKGMTVTARYQEVGRGWSKKRPEFQRMLADAKRGRFDTIVCWKSDRLSRGMYPAAALMEVIEAYHINLEAVMDAIDMKTFGLMAAIGKIELDNFRERASMGKRGTAKQGRIPVSNVPYGYRIGDDGRPVIVEEEAEVVRRIYRMCVSDGMGASVIGQRLNAEAVPLAKLGKRWYDGTIHRILSNETYKGTWWYGKARYVSTEDGVRVYEQPEEDWIGCPSRRWWTRRPGRGPGCSAGSVLPEPSATPRSSTCCSTWSGAPSAACSWGARPIRRRRSSATASFTSTSSILPAGITDATATTSFA